MREFYSRDWDLSSIILPDKLNDMIESGIVLHQNCFVLRDALEANPHIRIEECQDRTGYEALMNHIHIEQYTDKNFLPVGFGFLQKVSDILHKQFPDETFYGIVGVDLEGRDCVVRFHCMHEGEIMWLEDDLEGYKIDAVCLIHL